MKTTLHAALLAASLGLVAAPAWSYGQIDSFEASATQVVAGTTVWFNVGWQVQGSFQNGGGSNLDEPAPVVGYQEWLQNWYWTEAVTARGIDLQVGDQSHSERFQLPDGSGASGSWGFSMLLDTPGTLVLTVGGGFSALQSSTLESQLASRSCQPAGDPESGEYLVCDSSWSLSYPQIRNESEFGGSLNTPSLQIEVLAVPEPATAALWLAGLAGLVTLGRRRAGGRLA